MPDEPDIAELLRDEARVAWDRLRADALPLTVSPRLFERAADEIEEAHRALDQLGAARQGEDVALAVAGRVRWLVRDRQSYLDVWTDILIDALMNQGVTLDQIREAREWADLVMKSK